MGFRFEAEDQVVEDGIDLEFEFLVVGDGLGGGGFFGGGDHFCGTRAGGGEKVFQ